MAEQASSTSVLLSGGSPQIPKCESAAPVNTYIAALPGWKSDAGSRLNTLIEQTVLKVHKSVKWNLSF